MASDTNTDDDEPHPIDAVLRIAAARLATDPGDKSREESHEVIIIDDVASTVEDSHEVIVADADRRARATTLAASCAPTPTVQELLQRGRAALGGKEGPVGVTIVETAVTRNAEVQRLLRVPRYFDDEEDDKLGNSMRCFNCGQVGHAARECANAARVKPCYLCAQFGHDGINCPNRLCFKCGKPGHVARDCPAGRTLSEVSVVCLRCGSSTCPCAGKGDIFRYEGGCSNQYTVADLLLCKCYCCGQLGHLCCKAPPQTPVRLSCYNCGRMGHLGEHCTEVSRPHLTAERNNDVRREQQQRLQQQQQHYRYDQQQQNNVHQGGGQRYTMATGGGGAFDRMTPFVNTPPAQTAFWQHDSARMNGGGGGGGRIAPLFTSNSAPMDRYAPSAGGGGRYISGGAGQYGGGGGSGGGQYGGGGTKRARYEDDGDEAFPRGHGGGSRAGAARATTPRW